MIRPHDGEGAGTSNGIFNGNGFGHGSNASPEGDGFGDGWYAFEGDGKLGNTNEHGGGSGDGFDGMHGDGMSSHDERQNCFVTYTDDARGAVINAALSEQVAVK